MVQPFTGKQMTRFIETDVSTRIFRLCSGVNESIMTAANEPSLGLYRVQEHAVNTIPKLIKERHELDELNEKVKGVNFDLSYDLEAVRDISRVTNFDTILFDLKKSIEIKQLLNKRELESRQRVVQERATPTRSLPVYGSTGESPPLLRRGGPHSINATPVTSSLVGPGKGFGTVIQPKQF